MRWWVIIILIQAKQEYIFPRSFIQLICSRRDYINPLVPSAHKSVRIAKISNLKLEGIIKKISYERRDYESVDEKSLS